MNLRSIVDGYIRDGSDDDCGCDDGDTTEVRDDPGGERL